MLEMKLFFVFLLLYCGTAVCQVREYIYINDEMSWSDAQRYCREHYVDLATITTDEENKGLENAVGGTSFVYGWIGLNRTAPGSNIWQWSDLETPNFFQWMTGQPDNNQNLESCGMVFPYGWNDLECTDQLPSYCSWRFVLVKDSKTWDEALEYCRTYYTGLASPISPEQLALATNAIVQTQTISMWAGLHFVDGQWVSVNSVPLRNLVFLPSCPALRYRCGALNHITLLWENRDCNEKLNFLCY